MTGSNTFAEHIASGITPVRLAAYVNKTQKIPKRLLNAPANDISSVTDSIGCLAFKRDNKLNLVISRMNKFGEKANSWREHVRLGPKVSETVKGKLRLGAQILQLGGLEKTFRRIFNCEEGEKLIKASQCYLSTTTGPIAGLLFISTQRVSFCSERSVKFSSPDGEIFRYRYKVSVPIKKIEKTIQRESLTRPSEKYIQLETADGFEFWFMGFLNYRKTFQSLKHTVSQAGEAALLSKP